MLVGIRKQTIFKKRWFDITSCMQQSGRHKHAGNCEQSVCGTRKHHAVIHGILYRQPGIMQGWQDWLHRDVSWTVLEILVERKWARAERSSGMITSNHVQRTPCAAKGWEDAGCRWWNLCVAVQTCERENCTKARGEGGGWPKLWATQYYVPASGWIGLLGRSAGRAWGKLE